MKAWILHDINHMKYEEIAIPAISEFEVLVEVKAAGICGSDIPRIYENGAHQMPLILGHEFSGVVVQMGEQVEKKWLGKRVGIFPLIPCQKCGSCRKKQYEMCQSYSYLGSRTNGGFAEYVAVPVWNLIEIPDEVSFVAASMMEPMAVAVHAIHTASPMVEENIVVCGLGTIGMFVTMFLLEAGFRNLYVIGNKNIQKIKVQELGLPESNYFDSRNPDMGRQLREHTKEEEINLFFECVGKLETVSLAIDIVAPSGRIQLIGNPASKMAFDKDVYWKILRKQLTIKGSWNSSFMHDSGDDWHYVLQKIRERNFRPEVLVTQKYVLSDLEQGIKVLKDKTEQYIKVIVADKY